jgi:hypothetical protein
MSQRPAQVFQGEQGLVEQRQLGADKLHLDHTPGPEGWQQHP